MDSKSFDCKRCEWGRHCNDDNPASYPKWVVKFRDSVVIESKTCLLPMVDSGVFQLIGLYSHYKNSAFAFSGGILDQPNYYIQLMNFIGDVLSEQKK